MLCFEFEDGGGGSLWPVSDAWRPPPGVDAFETPVPDP
jgi:hypothetical protein